MTLDTASNSWKEGEKIIINVNDFFNAEFEIIKILSDSGGFGEISLIQNENMTLVVKNQKEKNIKKLQKYGKYYTPREAKILLTLDYHPNVITCFMIANLNGLSRLIMEYADKGSLRELIVKGLHLKDILHISIQVCTGLSHAHTFNEGLIHRDLKPENILLASFVPHLNNGYNFNYVIKVADFGLAKVLMDEESQINEDSLNTGVGTPVYMSPEQYGYFNNLDKDTDVYSFGVILCEMITGIRPFDKERINSFVTKQVKINDHIDKHIKQYKNDCPENLISIVKKCVQFDPVNRWKKEKEQQSYSYFDTIKRNLIKIYEELFNEKYVEVKCQNSYGSFLYIMRGGSLSRFYQFNFSIVCYDRVIELEPNNPNGYNNKAIDLSKLGRNTEALELVNRALNLDPKYINGYIVRGNILSNLEKYDDAIHDCDEAISLDQNAKMAYNNKAKAFLGKKDLPKALENADMALQIDQNYIKPLLIKGIIYAEMNNHEESDKFFEKALSIDSSNFESYIVRANLYQHLNRDEDAQIWLNKAINLHPDDKIANRKIALILYGQKEFREAIKFFDEYLKRERSSNMSYLRAICLKEIKKYDDAILSLKKIIETDPIYSPAYSEIALMLDGQKEYDEAIRYYTEFLKLEKNSAYGHNNLGVTLQKKGNFAEALKEFNNALQINSDYALAWSGKGATLNSLDNDYEALKCCEMAVKIDPQYANGWRNTGFILINMKRFDEAICCLDESLCLNPQSIDALAYKGYSLEMVGRTKESLKTYQTVLSKDPDNQIAIDGMKRLSQQHE